MFKLGFIWGALFLATLLYMVAAGHYDLATTQNQVTFTASAPGFEFDGKAKAKGSLLSTPLGFKGNAHVDVADFKTGINGRDVHLQNLLEVTKFPVVDLQFEGLNTSFSGDLTFHGVTKKIEGKAQRAPLRLTFEVKLSDYGVDTQKVAILGVPLIGDVVSITARVEE